MKLPLPGRLRTNDEQGIAIVTVMLVGMILAMLGTLMLDISASSDKHAARTVRTSTAFQGAEAGIGDYIAKLQEDSQYYLHFVHPGESTRRPPTGSDVSPGSAWNSSISVWTYPNGLDNWRSLGNGYEYNLRVDPPTVTTQWLRIRGTSRRAGATTEWRAVEYRVRPSTIADFQMIANANIVYGSTASTYGKIYAGIDGGGVAHTVTHQGSAYASVYAEKAESPKAATKYFDGARKYDPTTTPDIRSQIPNKIDFALFTNSMSTVRKVAQSGGVYLNDLTADAWRLTLTSSGTTQVDKCKKVSGKAVHDTAPTCTFYATYSIPPNGAIFSEQTVVVSGSVNGRFTIAANAAIVIGGDISYVNPEDDTLGLIAKTEMVVAHWVGTNLSWRAATIAQEDMWRSSTGSAHHGTVTFTGSTATNDGGYMSMFSTRVYNYDPQLKWLQPPYFPAIEGAPFVILSTREIVPEMP